MCKHLIREANKCLDNKPLTDLRFFLELRRNHFPPHYSIPGIHTSAQPDGDEDPQPRQVLVLGIRGVAAPTRAERPELARESASVNGGKNQSSTGGEETDPSENNSHKDTEAARMDDALAEDKDVAEEEGSDRDGRVSFEAFDTLHPDF
jgi:hypothetical protein